MSWGLNNACLNASNYLSSHTIERKDLMILKDLELVN